MQTPPLRRRVIVLGVAVVVIVTVALDALLYFGFRARLHANLANVLDERAELVRREAAALDPPALAEELQALGIRATVTAPDGTVYRADPPSPILGGNLPPGHQDGPTLARRVALPNGARAVVFARGAGVEDALQKLLALEAMGLVLATALATILLLLASRVALRPLGEIAASAQRTAAGARGERLRPDRRDTALGGMAAAYDDMLDALERAIAEAREAQATSEKLRQRARQIIETSTAAFVAMDSSGTIVDWTPNAERTFGWSREEAVGRVLAETIIPPAFRAAHQQGLERYLATGQALILGRPVELSALHRDGHIFPVEVTIWATQEDGEAVFNAFVQDITERRRGQDAAARLAAIVETAQEAIYTRSLDGTLLTWNRGAELLYGYTAEEVIGRHVSIIIPPELRDQVERSMEIIRRGEVVPRHETRRRCKDGTDVDVAVTTSPIRDETGRVVAASTIARDITEQRRLASALESTLAALESALGEARQAEERSRRFLADASHQLRTPIAGIRALAETLLRGTTAEDRDRLMADLVRETSRAGRLLASLLQLARLDQGRELVAEPVDLVALCESELDRQRALAPDLDIVLRTDHLPEDPPEVDPHAVKEIVANLLDNARRHASSRMELTVGMADGQVEIRVADDGPGVDEAMTERIFERFVSLDGRGGSGLGLPIARALARSHGGDLFYRDRRFVLCLPGTPLGHQPAHTPP